MARITKADGSAERQVLTAMVVNTKVLGRVAQRWPKDGTGMFASDFANKVGGWCVKYHRKYGKAPRKEIQGLYRAWADRTADQDTVKLVEKFLHGLSGQYAAASRGINPDYAIDEAADLFNRVRAESLVEAVTGDISVGRVQEAIDRISKFARVDVSSSAYVDVLSDYQAMREVIDDKKDVLFRYPGALGDFYGDAFERDGFVAFLGPEKRGKCVAEDQDVMLADGRIKTVKEMVDSKDRTPILALDETSSRFVPNKVTQFWDNGEKVCYELTTKSGRKVITTGNHKYLTPSGWKYLNEIEPKEFVAVPKRLAYFGSETPDDNLVKFLAYMAAEGCCVHMGQTNFTNTDPEMIADFHASCDALGISHRRKDITTYLRKPANAVLKEYGLYGKKSIHKTIPEVIFSSTKDKVALFLRIFFSCDGCIYSDRGRRKIELTLGSEKLVRQIGYLLTRFGVVYKIMYGEVMLNGKLFPNWRLLIGSEEYINLFLEEINFISYKRTDPSVDPGPKKSFLDRVPSELVKRACVRIAKEGPGRLGKALGRKRNAIRDQVWKNKPMMRQSFVGIDHPAIRALMDSEILWDEVAEIRCVGKRKTYDLGVPEHHNFVANNCVVHNTYHLLDLAWRAMLKRRRVAFFEVGDLSRKQIMRRFYTRALGRPVYATRKGRPVRIPDKFSAPKEEGDQYDVTHSFREWEQDATPAEIKAACRKIMDDRVRDNQSYLRVSVHPNSSISVQGVRSVLDDWRADGWGTPDVVVIDYADILASPAGFRGESRDAVNENWKAMRRLSQEMHCLVVTATQANAASYKAETLGMENFSEDKRKFAHVTGMVGLNQNKQEKADGVQRLNFLVLREDEFSSDRECYVATCLGLANPVYRSAM